MVSVVRRSPFCSEVICSIPPDTFALHYSGEVSGEVRGVLHLPVRACETVIMRPIVQSTFAALWSAVLVFWEAASVEAAHEREAIPQPSRRGG